MTGRGGRRPGAGRKPGTGTSPAWRISQAFNKERQRLADLLEERGFDPIERLVDLAEDPSTDPKVAVLATSTIAQYVLPRPPVLEERASIQLMNIDSPEDIVKAVGQVAALVAAGEIPTKQALALVKSLELAVETFHSVEAARELEQLKRRLNPVHEQLPHATYGAN